MRTEQKAVDLWAELVYRFTEAYNSETVTHVIDLTSGTGTIAVYIVKNGVANKMISGTAAIAGLHVPATQVVCIEKDPEVFELARERVEKFMNGDKFLLSEAYGIFAKLKLIPQNGACESAGEIQEMSQEDEPDDEADAREKTLEDEEVDLLDLVSYRLRLRPTHECCVAGGFLEINSGAVIEARKSGKFDICRSRIPGAGKGVFATASISRGDSLLPYWGDVYVISAENLQTRVAELHTERLVKTKKYIKNGAQKHL